MQHNRLSVFSLFLLSAFWSAPNQASHYEQCLTSLQSKATNKGVTSANYNRYTANLKPDMTVLDFLDSQPEFTTDIWDYMAALVDQQRVDEGQQQLKKQSIVLSKISARYHVDPMTVVAIWGIESDYGKTQGKRSLLTSLSTLSCYGRRQKFFQNEFLTTLKLIQSGDLPSASVTGSWAGAMGQTQFMPSTYERLAVDGDGDGRRNLITNSADALASTANYLKRAGWREGHVWGYEVRIPKGFNASLAGRKKRRALSDWAHKGIVKIDGSPLPANKEQAAILLPAGVNGPAFIVLHNFNAIYSYNASESYALAIAHLSDRLRGGTPFITPWPTNNPGLSRIDRKKLQKLLITRGYDIGKVDGLIGSATRNAIITEQKRLGMTPQDGRASVGILTRLQKESVTTGN